MTIKRFHTRYRGPRGEQGRLRRITGEAIERPFERAIEQAGVPDTGYLCIQALHAEARLPLGESDGRLADRLAIAIADAIAAVACGTAPVSGERPAILYYMSRAHALVDLTVAALTGQYERSWAWRQIGIWPTDAPVSASGAGQLVLRALAREPEQATAVLAYVAGTEQSVLAKLVTTGRPDAWIAVARAVGQAHGLSPLAIGDLLAPHWVDDRDSSEIAVDAGTLSLILRSTIARAVVESRLSDLDADMARAIGLLASLEVEPALATSASAVFVPRVRAAQRAMASMRTLVADSDDRRPEGADAGDPRGDVARPPIEATAERSTQRTEPADVDLGLPIAVRQGASTAWGGLLYLLNLLARPDLVQALIDDPLAGRARGPRWFLHQLALTLTAAEPDDAAVLAFAGLLPDAPPPTVRQPPATSEERATLERVRDHLEGALRDLLRLAPASTVSPIDFVCRRRATIAADPGWIEAHFPLDDVSIAIRRAGLDRDPGWLPWLGLVVRFVYE